MFARGKEENNAKASKAKQARQSRPEDAEKSEKRTEKAGQVVSQCSYRGVEVSMRKSELLRLKKLTRILTIQELLDLRQAWKKQEFPEEYQRSRYYVTEYPQAWGMIRDLLAEQSNLTTLNRPQHTLLGPFLLAWFIGEDVEGWQVSSLGTVIYSIQLHSNVRGPVTYSNIPQFPCHNHPKLKYHICVTP